MPRKLLFIINPNAGKKISDRIVREISSGFPASLSYRIVIWKNKDDFSEIESLLSSGEFTEAVAVGGDGTVNRVAEAILGTPMALGIIPIGSGNGLARSLGLSADVRLAIKQLVEGRTSFIDTGFVNGRLFLCTSGVGFDAHIGRLFAESVRRGLGSYIAITIRELWRYRASTYRLFIGDRQIERKAFLVTVANAGQYGNDFYIAPQAKLTDGKFHVVVLKPFHPLSVFGIFFRIITGRADKSSSIETYVTDKLTISRERSGTIHFDGEPGEEGPELNYTNAPARLRAIVGIAFAG